MIFFATCVVATSNFGLLFACYILTLRYQANVLALFLKPSHLIAS